MTRPRLSSRGIALARRLTRSGAEPEAPQPIPEGEPEPRFDDWLAHYFGDRLSELDAACAGAAPEAYALFRGLDDDLWALLLGRQYDRYPNIRAFLPDLPDPSLQMRWNGAAGLELLDQSKAFYVKAKERYSRYSEVGPLTRVLDFGCGWGRLTRFFARDVAPGALFGCDPVDDILDVCRELRVPAILARCDFVPERLPFDGRFDLVFAFSVFTHISEAAHEACLRAIHAALNPGGLLIVTIRSPAYLDRSEPMRQQLASLGPDPLAALAEPRYLFLPHPADPGHPQYHEGEMTYGETIISLPYIERRWAPLFELLDVSLMTGDIHQVAVTLRRN